MDSTGIGSSHTKTSIKGRKRMSGDIRLANDIIKDIADRGGLPIAMPDPYIPPILCCYQSLFVAIEIVEPGTPTAFPDFVDAVEMAGGIWIAASSVEEAMLALDELEAGS